MEITSAIYINLKKLKKRTGKAMFLILPIMVLVVLSIVVSSQVDNVKLALDKYVFEKIEDENTVIELTYQVDQGDLGNSGSRQQNFMTFQNGFTEADLATIAALENVESASINYTVPISNVATEDLFDGKTLEFSQIQALNEAMAGNYTTEDFTYTEGDVIPIILNASTFIETYEDWGGQDTITVDFESMRSSSTSSIEGEDPRSAMENLSPVKSKAISYNKDDLIGTTFTVTFGGFSEISDVEMGRSAGVMTYTKLTDEEIAAEEEVRKTAISEYWNYDQLAAGVTYTFKVVGVIESEGSTVTYVPESFAKYVVQKYIENQISAQNGTEIPTSVLNSTFTGMTYDGSELTSSNTFIGFGGGSIGMPGSGMNPGSGGGPMMGSINTETDTESYEIPGLVIQVAEDDNTEVEGICADTTIFETSIKRGNNISVKVDSVANRTAVVEAINNAGYAFQDINDLDIFNEIQSNLNKISFGVVVAFIVVSVAVIIFTMSKFVSESTREIGIFRAIGFTKGNILQIFLLQSFIYTAVGYLVGVAIGYGVNLVVARFVTNWFNNFITGTVNQTFAVVSTVDSSIFNGFSLNAIGILSGILFGITLIVSFVPAMSASSVSPVEAIKKE